MGNYPHDCDYLNTWEIKVRDEFVNQLFIDQDYVAAAVRTGFRGNDAIEYGHRFKRDPYVQRKIVERHKDQYPEQYVNRTPTQQIIFNGLMREAHNTEPGSSHSARVGAFAHLSKIEGLEAPTRVETKVEHSGSIESKIDFSKFTPEELKAFRKAWTMTAELENE